MINETDWVVIGRFGRPHGIKGLITVVSFTEPRENILGYSNWHLIGRNNQWQPLTLLHKEINNKFILTQVEGYSDREQVASLTNREIAVARTQLQSLGPNEYYWHQLIGMDVVNKTGDVLGVVTDIMATGSNDVLVVTGARRRLIPYLPNDVVMNVDDSQRIITVDWDMDF